MASQSSVRVRFAPSPTGFLHIGGARTALFNWLFARHNGGQFILRIEDTDRTRFQPEALADIMTSLRWLRMDWDEGPEVGGEYGPYFQSDRLDIYHRYAEELVRSGHAYRCYCSEERLQAMRAEQAAKKLPAGYDRQCRWLTDKQRAEYEAQGVVPVIRLVAPLEGATRFYDVIRGESVVENNTLDDLVLLKSDGFPTYHLANVVDDHLMEITHIMRADEWLPSVPRHVLLYNAFGWEIPVYAHLPIILSPDGKGKMSKRFGATAVHEFRKEGYIPEGMLNYLARVGWAYDDKTEFFTQQDLIDKFSLDGVNKAPAAFSYQKLESTNAEHIRLLASDDLGDRLDAYYRQRNLPSDPDMMRGVAPLIQERIKKLSDAVDMLDFFFTDDLQYAGELLVGKKMTAAESAAALQRVSGRLNEATSWEEKALEASLYALAEEMGVKPGTLFGIVRVAVTGKTVSPPLFGTLAVLGRECVLDRLSTAESKLAALAADLPS